MATTSEFTWKYFYPRWSTIHFAIQMRWSGFFVQNVASWIQRGLYDNPLHVMAVTIMRIMASRISRGSCPNEIQVRIPRV